MSSEFRKRQLAIELLATTALVPNPRNARKHPRRQINKIARSIETLGWATPLVIDEDNVVLCGNGRLEAAKELGLVEVPCVRLIDLNEPEKTALALADNKLGDGSSFDDDMVKSLLTELASIDFDMVVTGFEAGEVDFIVDGPAGAVSADPADEVVEIDEGTPAITQSGDVWQLGRHRLTCGSALDEAVYAKLLKGDLARMVFVDCPYNVSIPKHVSGLGKHKHQDFQHASGELSEQEFRDDFLRPSHQLLAANSVDGSLHFSCMDWRSIATLIEACKPIYSEYKNLLVWVKRSGSMGSHWRSQHELIAVFKQGTAPHINNVELGKNGRYRTNVLDYPGANTFGPTRDADLEAHPTVKPTRLIADLIKDVSNRGDLILDAFAGSGSLILAAEQTKRRAAAIEIDPRYCDVAIRRWQKLTKKKATLEGDGRTFDEIAAERAATGSPPSSNEEEAA